MGNTKTEALYAERLQRGEGQPETLYEMRDRALAIVCLVDATSSMIGLSDSDCLEILELCASHAKSLHATLDADFAKASMGGTS